MIIDRTYLVAGVSAVLLLAGSFYAGYDIASNRATIEMQEFKLKLEAEARNENQKIADVFKQRETQLVYELSRYKEERDRLDADNGNLLRLSERLRQQLDSANLSTVPKTTANTAVVDTAKYATCKRLLAESVELLREGAEILGRTATDKDSLSNLIKETEK